jgi:DNA (cytosine-5)-methyltransferase 1
LIKYNLINFCEIDKYATQSYCAIHNEPESKNLGDITKVNENELSDFNMMVGGSPCQDFSVAGKQEGAKWTCKDCNYEYNPLEAHYSTRDKCPKCSSINIEKTRSSLLVEWLRILRAKKPNLAIYENVKNIVGKQFKATFDLFIAELHEYGYNTYWKVLNVKDYRIPQNRERVYLIIIKKELDNGRFEFPEGFDNNFVLKDILENEDKIDKKYYISQETTDKLIEQNKNINKFIETNKKQKIICEGNIYPRKGQNGNIYNINGLSPTLRSGQGVVGCGIGSNNAPKILEIFYFNKEVREYENFLKVLVKNDKEAIENISDEFQFVKDKCMEYYNKNGYLPKMFNPYNQVEIIDIAPTQTTSCNRSSSSAAVLIKDINYRIRKLIPLECWRLMGFKDEDFYKAKDAKVSDTQLYKQAGNSIVVDVLYYIYLELYKTMPYLLEDIKLGSFFSGIGAFEKAIDRLMEYVNDKSDLNNYS